MNEECVLHSDWSQSSEIPKMCEDCKNRPLTNNEKIMKIIVDGFSIRPYPMWNQGDENLP